MRHRSRALVIGALALHSLAVHVRLTVHADGATNADTRFKTSWATGCQPDNQDT